MGWGEVGGDHGVEGYARAVDHAEFVEELHWICGVLLDVEGLEFWEGLRR